MRGPFALVPVARKRLGLIGSGNLRCSYLVDALVLMHTTVYEQNQLNARTQKISSSPRPPSTATLPSSSNGGRPPSSSALTADSPASLTSSTSSPGAHSDLSSAAALPADYLPRVLGLTTSLSRSLRLLSTAHQLLSYPTLRASFPSTWRRSVTSPIAGCGGDGGAQLVDPDWVEGGWGWPIGMTGEMMPGSKGGSGPGAGGMLPHLVVFGRSLLKEWLEGRRELKGERYDLAKGFVDK